MCVCVEGGRTQAAENEGRQAGGRRAGTTLCSIDAPEDRRAAALAPPLHDCCWPQHAGAHHPTGHARSPCRVLPRPAAPQLPAGRAMPARAGGRFRRWPPTPRFRAPPPAAAAWPPRALQTRQPPPAASPCRQQQPRWRALPRAAGAARRRCQTGRRQALGCAPWTLRRSLSEAPLAAAALPLLSALPLQQ